MIVQMLGAQTALTTIRFVCFRSSMAMKDAMFAIAMSGYALWNILRTSQQREVTVGKTETQSLFDLVREQLAYPVKLSQQSGPNATDINHYE